MCVTAEQHHNAALICSVSASYEVNMRFLFYILINIQCRISFHAKGRKCI